MQIDATRILIRRRLSTILAADVAGYSRLMGANEERTLERLDDARAVMDATIVRYGGRIANTAGDSVIAEFANPAEAVRCALEVQEELRADHATLPAAERLQFRIGINLGSIMANGRDVLGDEVNIAARIENIAQPGGICISDAVYERIKGSHGSSFRPLGPQSLKNINRKVVVYEAVTPEAGRRVAPPPRQRRRLPLLALVAVGAVAAAVAALFATGVIRLEKPAPTVVVGTAEPAPPAPLPEPAAGPSAAAATMPAAAPSAVVPSAMPSVASTPAVPPAQPAVAAQPPAMTTPAAQAVAPAVAVSQPTVVPPPPAAAAPQVAALPSAVAIASLSAAAINAIQGFDCARLQVTMTGVDMELSGYVGSDDDAAAAVGRLAALPGVGHVSNQTYLLRPPLCRALDVLYEGTAAGSTALLSPLIDEGGAGGYYYEGDTLNVGVTATHDGYLYVDLIDGQKQEVVHLLPNDMRPDNHVRANQVVTIGTLAQERKLYKVAAPFGLNLLVAVQAPRPLFSGKRKAREPADAYLADLDKHLQALGSAGGKEDLLFSQTLVVFRHR